MITKFRLATATAVVLLATAVGVGAGVGTADAAARSFANCTEMHRVYRGGVARPGAVDRRSSGHARYAPKVSRALYAANTKSDRDHDGVACEQ